MDGLATAVHRNHLDVVGAASVGGEVHPLAIWRPGWHPIVDCGDSGEGPRHGVVDKFLGDGILALFNAPGRVRDHPIEACRAAPRMQSVLQLLTLGWEQQGWTAPRARIGIHVGDAIVGNIGKPDRFDYTVIGDTVNLASRLEGLNNAYGTAILASEDVRQATGCVFAWRTLDRVAVVGRTGGTTASELLGERGTVSSGGLWARDLYEAALGSYLDREFDVALERFRAAQAARPDDQAARCWPSGRRSCGCIRRWPGTVCTGPRRSEGAGGEHGVRS